MSNNKQSSLDFIYHELFVVKRWMDLTPGDIEYIFNKAKAMHKEEMIDFAMKFMMQDRPIISFYNETFGGNNEQQ